MVNRLEYTKTSSLAKRIAQMIWYWKIETTTFIPIKLNKNRSK